MSQGFKEHLFLRGCSAIVGGFSGRGEACLILAAGMSASTTIVDISDTGITINTDPVVAFELEVTEGGL